MNGMPELDNVVILRTDTAVHAFVFSPTQSTRK